MSSEHTLPTVSPTWIELESFLFHTPKNKNPELPFFKVNSRLKGQGFRSELGDGQVDSFRGTNHENAGGIDVKFG